MKGDFLRRPGRTSYAGKKKKEGNIIFWMCLEGKEATKKGFRSFG